VETDLPGPLANKATAIATDRLGGAVTGEATASVNLKYTASLVVTKTPSAPTAAIGESITYQYSVKNTGNVTISALSLADDRLGAITLDRQSLAPDEEATGSASRTIAEEDLPGPMVNKATATATDRLGKDVSSETRASVDLTYTASMDVAKTPSPAEANVGETITYTYTVKNTGTVSIKGLKLSDNKLKEIQMDKSDLAPGDTATGSATYIVSESDLPGPLTNVVTATAKDAAGRDVTGSATAEVPLTYSSSITVAKTASPAEASVGDAVTYTYTVTNTGDVTLKGLALTDDKLGNINVKTGS